MIINDDKNSIENLKFFIEKWAGDALLEYGLSEDEVPNYLPNPLREVYLFAGNWVQQRENDNKNFMQGKQPRIFQEQDCLLGIENLKRKNGRITFLIENQGTWTCEVDENNDESPVYCDSLEVYDSYLEGHQIICKSLSHFLVTFCLQELVMGSKYVGIIEAESEEELVKSDLQALWLNGFYVFKEPTHSFYICDNRLLIMKVYGEFWCACNEENALSLLKNRELYSAIW
jgi:hypothetical protein